MADSNSPVIKIVLGVFGLIALLLVIILPISFGTLEYYEYGFRRQKSTGTVSLDKVYMGGRHFIGPDFEFKVFKASAHEVSLNRITAFTREKLEVKVSCTFQYFLRKRDLALLHAAYDIHYEDVMVSSSVDAIKGAMVVFDTSETFENRSDIENLLFKAVRERLGGTCCPEDCSTYPNGECPYNCRSGADCTDRYKGIYADVRFFQLGFIEVPRTVEEKYLKKLTLDEETLREKLFQDAQVVRKATDALVKKIKNEAYEISQNAVSQSDLINIVSQANYTSAIEKARSQGLRELYRSLNLVSQEHKNSYDYLRTLRGLDNIHLTVDFQQRIAGSFK